MSTPYFVIENDRTRDTAKDRPEAMHAIIAPNGLAIFPNMIIKKAAAKGVMTRYGIIRLGLFILLTC
jgi:hypothetical protein